ELSMTMRKPDGSASAWAGAAGVHAADIDGQKLAARAAEKVKQWVDPQALPPGKYTVVLEAAAVGDLLDFVGIALDARAAEEGHSAFSAAGGKTREGEAIFASDVTLDSDPADALSPGLPWAEGGLRSEPPLYAQAGV